MREGRKGGEEEEEQFCGGGAQGRLDFRDQRARPDDDEESQVSKARRANPS